MGLRASPFFRRWWWAAALLALGACAAAALALRDAPPASDLQSASSALREAEDASSGRWAISEVEHARALLDEARGEVAAQDARLLFRGYARARTLLAAARADAEASRTAALLERDAAKAEASDAVKRARSMLDGARAALQIAPSPRDGHAELERLRSELHSVESELPGIDRLIVAGDYRVAAQRGAELAARVEAAVSTFFSRMERGGYPVAAGDQRAEAAECPGGRPALSLLRADPQEEGSPCSKSS